MIRFRTRAPSSCAAHAWRLAYVMAVRVTVSSIHLGPVLMAKGFKIRVLKANFVELLKLVLYM